MLKKLTEVKILQINLKIMCIHYKLIKLSFVFDLLSQNLASKIKKYYY